MFALQRVILGWLSSTLKTVHEVLACMWMMILACTFLDILLFIVLDLHNMSQQASWFAMCNFLPTWP